MYGDFLSYFPTAISYFWNSGVLYVFSWVFSPSLTLSKEKENKRPNISVWRLSHFYFYFYFLLLSRTLGLMVGYWA